MLKTIKNKNYIYQEGDCHCDKCGAIGDFLGGGKGEDGIDRCALLGLNNNEVICEDCL
jgi:hypothetical protein